MHVTYGGLDDMEINGGTIDLMLIPGRSERCYGLPGPVLKNLDQFCAFLGLQRENDGDSVVYQGRAPSRLKVRIGQDDNGMRYNITHRGDSLTDEVNGLTIDRVLREDFSLLGEVDFVVEFPDLSPGLACRMYESISEAIQLIYPTTKDSVAAIESDITGGGLRRINDNGNKYDTPEINDRSQTTDENGVRSPVSPTDVVSVPIDTVVIRPVNRLC